MKKVKKTLSYYKARWLDFVLYLTISTGIVYMLVVSLCGFKVSLAVGIVLGIVVLFTAGIDIFFKKDKDDELAKYSMSIAHEKLSKTIPWFIIAATLVFLIFFRDGKAELTAFEILLIVILQPSLYLTVEQGLFLFIHGRETKEYAEDDEDE